MALPARVAQAVAEPPRRAPVALTSATSAPLLRNPRAIAPALSDSPREPLRRRHPRLRRGGPESDTASANTDPYCRTFRARPGRSGTRCARDSQPRPVARTGGRSPGARPRSATRTPWPARSPPSGWLRRRGSGGRSRRAPGQARAGHRPFRSTAGWRRPCRRHSSSIGGAGEPDAPRLTRLARGSKMRGPGWWGGARMADRRRWARLGAVFVSLGLIAWVGAAAAGERVIKGPGPAAWQGDLAPISDDDWSYDRAAHLLERAGFGGTPEEIETLAAMTPAQAVAHLVDYESDRQRPPARVRAVRHPRSRSRQLSAEPAGDHRARQRDRRGARRQGQAGRQPAAPAGGRQVLLLAAREHARDPPRRLLVGGPHAQHRAPARGEDDAVLARPFRHQRGQGARRAQDAAPERDLPRASPPAISASSWWRPRRTRRCSPSSTPGLT